MGLQMPTPARHPVTGIFLYRSPVPANLIPVAKGKPLMVPAGEELRRVLVGADVKVSLSTREPAEAKRRHAAVADAVREHWASLRAGPEQLTHKQIIALAGEIRAAFIEALDDAPSTPEQWEGLWNESAGAVAGISSSGIFCVGNSRQRRIAGLEGRIVDAVRRMPSCAARPIGRVAHGVC